MAYKILIIDDDTELLKMLKKYLEIKKYEIITAENGLEGINKIKLQPDIILLDVNMPNIDGIEVCRRVRDKVACPILFLTAGVDEQDVVNGLSSGGDDYILKPFSLKELDARITAHLKRETRRKEKTECCFQGELAILEKEYGKQCMLQVSESKEEFYGDKEIILEVTENLLSNALRHGKRQVKIMVKAGYAKLSICVMDDGDGFREDAEKITEAFYGQNVKDSLKHAGLGMYISRLYCEKHGGKLVLGNDEHGGAVVTAIFRRIV